MSFTYRELKELSDEIKNVCPICGNPLILAKIDNNGVVSTIQYSPIYYTIRCSKFKGKHCGFFYDIHKTIKYPRCYNKRIISDEEIKEGILSTIYMFNNLTYKNKPKEERSKHTATVKRRR